jgi:predicted outer membrane protein
LGGTLPIDMLPPLRSRGLAAEAVYGNFPLVKDEIRTGRPVLAYLDFGTRRHPIGHYVVITGFDDSRRALIIHSGRHENKLASYKRFDRGWNATNRWMVVAGPGISTPTVPAVPAAALENRLTAADHVRLGQIYDQQLLKAEATDQYRRALKIDKTYVPAWVALGNQTFTDKKWRAAEKFFKRALRLEPDNPGANNNLAMTYLMEGKNLEKAEELAKAAAADPAYALYAQDTLAQLARKKKTPEHILSELNRINRAQLDMAAVAKDRWKDISVRTFAFALATDHKNLQEKLETLAKKMAVPLAVDSEAAANINQRIDQLKNVEQAGFDHAFSLMTAEDHQAYIADLSRARAQARGPVKDLLQETLPVLKKHRRAAIQLAETIK